jgi:hypothetical protein
MTRPELLEKLLPYKDNADKCKFYCPTNRTYYYVGSMILWSVWLDITLVDSIPYSPYNYSYVYQMLDSKSKIQDIRLLYQNQEFKLL